MQPMVNNSNTTVMGFQVGVTLIENTIDHLDRSRVAVLVLSPSFDRESWCSFELHLAKSRMIEGDRSSSAVVILKGLAASERKKRTLDYVTQTSKCVRWPASEGEGDTHELRTFYSRLKKCIGSSGVHFKLGTRVSIDC